ncbi:RNA polymerase sigma factor [Phycisphaera mikurensis]|uniref:RNA polymerase ECF-type sigma factor n=1 Tax=Phycisphaera mikurensis (strain NBRC 102666 / KCTC 22515 / FYK2301M01) TaxID=1142394 RepID=I0IBK4_PHYMF|nr:RNA polymerase sigma factor [Phycisphaera mikurensis]MBB6442828.1 RNA polymerase sigma-70 factor (ECF subfamily) [Phycisphaera mikurensis]BAM02642.1 RNA polymerase ECF-type sigma factor [Phycisphaera mikurensis NBRC 102666]
MPARSTNPPPEGEPLDGLLRRGFGYALCLTHDAAAAEDLLQEALLGIARRGGPWHAGYLLAAVRNAWVDEHRRRGRRLPTSPLDAVAEDELVEPPADSVPRDELLGGLLGHLRPPDRELLYLAAVEGHTAAELAALTGRPRGTVLSSLFRAKKKLRRLASHLAPGAGRLAPAGESR